MIDREFWLKVQAATYAASRSSLAAAGHLLHDFAQWAPLLAQEIVLDARNLPNAVINVLIGGFHSGMLMEPEFAL